jgi:hypothetical protein
MAAIARTPGIEVTIGTAELLPFAAEEFDYALMVTTICFVDAWVLHSVKPHECSDRAGALSSVLLSETIRWEPSTQRVKFATRSTAMRGSIRLRKFVASSSRLVSAVSANRLLRKQFFALLTQYRMSSQLNSGRARDRLWC